MKTYLIGKIGKALKFDPNSWGGTGGDCDAPLLVEALAKTHPDDLFIVISKSDYSGNLKNILNLCDYCSKDELKDYAYILKKFKNIKIDGIIIFSGPTSSINVPEHVKKLREGTTGTLIPSILCQHVNYVAPIYHFLNETHYPYAEISVDPRYLHGGHDLFNHPVKILSQYDCICERKHVVSYEDETRIITQHEVTYNNVEKIFLLNHKMLNVKDLNKTNDFNIILNEGSPSRYPELKKWILDKNENVNIYGQWSEVIGNDNRFKGCLKFEDAQKIMLSLKFSFIISIKKGWVTSKYIELIANGVIPFYHPDYDTQNHTEIDPFCRVKTPEELKEKIQNVISDENFYLEMITKLQNQYSEWCDPNKLCNHILENTPQVENSGNIFTEINKLDKLELGDDW